MHVRVQRKHELSIASACLCLYGDMLHDTTAESMRFAACGIQPAERCSAPMEDYPKQCWHGVPDMASNIDWFNTSKVANEQLRS